MTVGPSGHYLSLKNLIYNYRIATGNNLACEVKPCYSIRLYKW